MPSLILAIRCPRCARPCRAMHPALCRCLYELCFAFAELCHAVPLPFVSDLRYAPALLCRASQSRCRAMTCNAFAPRIWASLGYAFASLIRARLYYTSPSSTTPLHICASLRDAFAQLRSAMPQPCNTFAVQRNVSHCRRYDKPISAMPLHSPCAQSPGYFSAAISARRGSLP